MLEGLEISIVNLKQVNAASYSQRIDSNFFQKEFLNAPTHIDSQDLADICQIRSGTTPSDRDENLKEGVILLKTGNIRNKVMNSSKEYDYFYIDNETNKSMSGTQLVKGDVLINIVGATTDVVGRCAIVDSEFPVANITQAMALLRVKNDFQKLFLPNYLFIYLISKFGHQQVRKIARPTGQFNMNLEEVGSIAIPKLTANNQLKISSVVDLSVKITKKSQLLYQEAEKLLFDNLGFSHFSFGASSTNIKSFRDSYTQSGRLDAEYYQIKYEQIENQIISNPKGHFAISSQFDLVKQTGEKLLSEYDYIEIGDVNISDGTVVPNRVSIDDLPDNAKIFAKRGDLIISKVRPNRGAVAIIECQDDILIVSGAFAVLRSKQDAVIKKETLKVLLRTPVYREWLLKFNVGTQYPVIRDEDILNLQIPNIDIDIQNQIMEKMQQSYKLKMTAESLVSLAKEAVEIMIEKNEAEGMMFIEKQMTQEIYLNY